MQIVEIIKKNSHKLSFQNMQMIIENGSRIDSFDVTVSSLWENIGSGDANGEYIFRVFEVIERHRRNGRMR